MTAYSRFPTEFLPEPIRSFVREGAAAIGVDPSMVALSLLAALGAAIGNTRRLLVKPDWKAPPILWTAVVAESGSAKSPAFKLALDPLRAAQSRAFEDHAEAMRAFDAEHARWKAARSRWEQEARSNPEAAGDPPQEPQSPTARRFIVSDVTVEALAPLLQANPRGVLLERDELSSWLGSFDRYARAGRASTDAGQWLSMFDAESITVDRKTGEPRTIHVPEAAVAITGTIQPGILARAIGQQERDSGLLARMLLACPPPRPIVWSEASVSADARTAIDLLFCRLLSLRGAPDEHGNEQPAMVEMDSEARAAWVAFYNESGERQADLTGDLAAAWSKLRGYVPRFALILHEVRIAANDPTVGDPRRVDAHTMRAAIGLARWFEAETERVYGMLGESDDERKARLLVELIRRMGGNVSGRELVQRSRMFKTVAEAEAELSRLVEAGAGSWVTPEQRGRGAPKARRFVLSPVCGVNAYRNAPDGATNTVSVGVDGVDMATEDDGWGEVGP